MAPIASTTTTSWLRRLKRRLRHFSPGQVTGLSGSAHRATLERILPAASPSLNGHSLHEAFGAASDDFWLWCFTEGYRQEARLRAVLPGFAPEEIQYQFAGAAGDDTMRDAFGFYTLVKRLVAQHLQQPPTSILEFGCGWGRIIRFFLKDVEPEQLWGIDCMPEAIALCQDTNKQARFELVQPFPPSGVPSERFDLIYSYSVFSHLSEDAHLAWLTEFKRILKPGGLLIATTRPREFILTCAATRNSRDAWAQGTALAFKDTEAALARFDQGEFLYDGLGGGSVLDASFFGETCIPRQYVQQHWTRLFEFLDYIDDRAVNVQNVIVVRKP